MASQRNRKPSPPSSNSEAAGSLEGSRASGTKAPKRNKKKSVAPPAGELPTPVATYYF